MQAEEENFYDEEYGLLKKIGRYKTNKWLNHQNGYKCDVISLPCFTAKQKVMKCGVAQIQRSYL
mgnify:FL=1